MSRLLVAAGREGLSAAGCECRSGACECPPHELAGAFAGYSPRNHQRITKESPKNHLRLTAAWRYAACLLLAVFVGIGNVWGADPDLSVTFDGDTYGDYIKTYSTQKITLTAYSNTTGTADTAFTGNTSGHYYLKNGNSSGAWNQNTFIIDASASGTYIDSVAICWMAESKNRDTNVAMMGWTSFAYGEEMSNTVSDTITTPKVQFGTAKSWDNKAWQIIKSDSALVAMALSRQLKSVYLTKDKSTKLGNFGIGQSLNWAGVKVWLHPAAVADETAPTLSSSTPANSATNVAVSGNIVLTFSENVTVNDASKFTLSGGAGSLTTGDISVSGAVVTIPYTGLANNTEYTFSTAAEAVKDGSNNKNAALSNIVFTTVAAATPVCPDGISISGTTAYTEGETISLTAALTDGNGDITYTWYKGVDLATAKAAGSIGTGTTFTKASCTTGDAGNYFCVATKDACSDEESSAYAVTVEEKSCPTSGVIFAWIPKTGLSDADISAGTYDLPGSWLTSVSGGTAQLYVPSNGNMRIRGSQLAYNSNNAYIHVVLDCELEDGDVIDINSSNNTNNIWLSLSDSRPSSAENAAAVIVQGTRFVLSSTNGSTLIGKKEFYVWRNSSTTQVGQFALTRPYAISFANGGHGTTPDATKGFEVELEQITGVEGWVHTGWTADKAVKVGETEKAAGAALDVDATVTVSADVTFTATWEKEAPTYSVTYRANNGTEEADVVHATESKFAANTFTAPEGKMFSCWNTQADGEGTDYAVGAAVSEATTVFAKWVVDPTIRLIKTNGTLNTVNFEFNSTKTTLQTADYTVEGVVYAKNVKLGGTATAITGINADKYIAYHTQTNSTHVEIALYDAYSSSTTHNVYIARVTEGNGTPVVETVAIATGTKRDYYKTYDLTGRTSLYIYVGNDNARVCQVLVTENGEPNVADAPAVGYSVNLNKGRMYAASGTAKTFEGLTYVVAEDYQPTNREVLKIKTPNTHYISFEIPEGQTRQLQVITSNTEKYTVSKTKGDAENQFTPTANTAKNWNLTDGVWYINPQGSNVNITNIAFVAAPAACTVTFKDGETTLGTQSVWSGDKATALSPAPTKSGYRFVKWQKAGEDYDFDAAVTADTQLDAVWQRVWTVTFDADNGSEATETVVDDNTAVSAPATNPEKAGFDFLGWTLDATAEPIVAYNFATLVTGDITLKAYYEVAQDDATLSALSYNGNAIDVASAVDVAGVQTYNVLLPWMATPTVDPALISFTKNAETATVSTALAYDSESKTATFAVTSGNGLVTVNYAIVFAFDAKRGTSIVKATTRKVVTGYIGGTTTMEGKTVADAIKIDKNVKFGITLANDETFATGDVFIMNITTAPGSAASMGTMKIYESADASTPLFETDVVGSVGLNYWILPAAVNGKKSLYIKRGGGNDWNPTFSYIEVTRDMSPAVKSFKFGENAATINEGAKTISIDVPYGTDVTALTPTVEAYGNNGATYTPAGEQDFTIPVNYVVTDGYSQYSTTYAVTVNVAAPSENAYLASLAVAGYALDFDKETEEYNVVLDYGTAALPEITYEVEDTGLAEAAKVEGGVNGATTITVTPQAGAGHEKVYTINFSVSTTPKFVIYDGSTMTVIGTSGSDVSTGFAWEMIGGKTDGGKDINITLNGKTYTKAQNVFGSPTNSTTRYIEITIPEGYVAKFYLAGATNSSETLRSSYISKDKTGTLDESIAYASTDQYAGAAMRSDYQLPGTYYYCADASIRLYELSVTLYPAYMRDVTVGTMGTVCIPQNVEADGIIGAEVYELLYWKYGTSYADCQMVDFGEVTSMQAGHAYLFIPTGDKLALVLGDEVAGAPVAVRGFTGTFDAIPAAYDNVLTNKYAVLADHIQKMGHNCSSPANRAYIDLSATPDKEGYEASFSGNAPAVRRISLGNGSARPVTTDLDNLNGSGDKAEKHLINGHLYIIRGGRAYDAEGRLVK